VTTAVADDERENIVMSGPLQPVVAADHPADNGVIGLLRNRPQARRLVLAGSVVVLAGIVWGWWYYSGRESTDDAQVDGHIVPIAARVGGTVQAVRVEDNQVVEAGTVLVDVDPRDYRVALQRAEADYADTQAALAAAEATVPITSTMTASQVSSAGANVERAATGTQAAAWDVEASRARLAVAQARFREATANAIRTSRDLERLKPLLAKDEVSQQQYDAAVAGADAARASVESAQAAITEATQAVSVAEGRRGQAANALTQAQADLRTAQTAPEQVNVTKARAQSAAARVLQAKALLEQATLNLAYTTIKAPTAGRVSKKSVEPGQVIQPGQPLLAIVPVEDVWITANFKETQLKDMRPGQRASISVDAFGRSYQGKVDSIAAATGARFSLLPPENATGNYVKVVQRIPVKIVLDKGQDPENRLRPGMSVVPTVYTR
jgi:membrane fusion protein (multidrug efflux system)